MKEGIRNELGLQLKKMLDHIDRAETKQKRPIAHQVSAISFAQLQVKKKNPFLSECNPD
jgi:hypothetical protein